MEALRARGTNDLWQMDFKGYFQTSEGPCHPLSVLDDYSRSNLGLQAYACQRHGTVQAELVGSFERYGLPVQINTHSGPLRAPRASLGN